MKILPLILLPCAGLGAGWFLRPWLRPVPAGTEGGSASAAPLIEPTTNQGGTKTAATLAPAVVKPEVLPPVDLSDPKAAVKSLLAASRAGKSPMRMQARLLAFADQLAAKDLQALALEVCQQPTNYWGVGGDSLKEVVLSRWVEVAPAEALAYVKGANTVQTREALGYVFGQLASQDAAGAEAALQGLAEGPRKIAMQSMAARLAGKDPLGALAMLKRQKSTSADYSTSMVISLWSRQDPASAASYATSMKAGQERSQAMYYVANGMAAKDPDAALAWANSLPKAGERANLVRTVIAEVAERDPQAALAMASAQPLREQRQLLQGVASNWMLADPDGAVAWVKTLPEGATRQDCLANMAQNAVWGGTEKLGSLIELMPKGQQRRETLENVSRYLGWYQEPEQSIIWAKTLPDQDRDLVIARLSGALAESDPKGAAALAEALPPSAQSVQALSRIASEWADSDPEAAMKWAATLESDKARQDAMSGALTQWADRDPEKAAGATGQITDANARRAARDRIAGTWAAKAPAEAERWAQALPPEDRYSALASVWNATALDDPAKAAQRLAALLPEAAGVESAGAKLAESAKTVATAWVNQNASQAAAWALTLPEGKARESAVGAVAEQWAGTDTMAASTWIDSLPAGASRDEASTKLINNILATDPEAAFTWASNISDPDKQFQSLKTTVNSWKIYNPAAVRGALTSSTLDAATLAKLEAELK